MTNVYRENSATTSGVLPAVENFVLGWPVVENAATTQVPELTIIKKMKTVIEMQIIRHCWGSAVLDFSNTIKG